MIQSPAGYQGDVRIKRYLDFYQAGYGVAMLSSGVAFSPLSLFANGEQGGWYDPSDLTTLYQDAAGTTPVTAVEQPVGRVLDKSGNGAHLSQSTAAARPVLSARVNALVNTATLSTQNVTTLATNYTLRFEGTGSIALSGTGSGTYSAGAHTVTCTAGTLTLTVTGSVTNADLRPANAGVGLPAYQRVGAATFGSSTAAGNADYDTTGFPYYLRTDGTDDGMSTASIDFTSTDKIAVFAGVRKLSDAAPGVIAELSAAPFNPTTNTFGVQAPQGGSAPYNHYTYFGGGTLAAVATTGTSGYPAPNTAVLTGTGDISGDLATLRVNAVQVSQATTNQGTGNFGNHPLFVGSRNNASSRFNGQIYGLVIVGRALTAAEISNMETWMNQRTKAF